ncbi:MAG: hypothetical protein ABSE77_16855, partial [Acidimicrobiales bacterium]
MAYDGATRQIVLFGGYGASPGTLSDTWTWNGHNWTEAHPFTSPGDLQLASMAYDPATSQLVLFGGYDNVPGGLASGATWTWNGHNWTEAHPSTSPPARAGA